MQSISSIQQQLQKEYEKISITIDEFNGITEHPLFNQWNETAIIVGAFMILLAIISVVLIDQWKDQRKKEELEEASVRFAVEVVGKIHTKYACTSHQRTHCKDKSGAYLFAYFGHNGRRHRRAGRHHHSEYTCRSNGHTEGFSHKRPSRPPSAVGETESYV